MKVFCLFFPYSTLYTFCPSSHTEFIVANSHDYVPSLHVILFNHIYLFCNCDQNNCCKQFQDERLIGAYHSREFQHISAGKERGAVYFMAGGPVAQGDHIRIEQDTRNTADTRAPNITFRSHN